jgi:hypothetical protein
MGSVPKLSNSSGIGNFGFVGALSGMAKPPDFHVWVEKSSCKSRHSTIFNRRTVEECFL